MGRLGEGLDLGDETGDSLEDGDESSAEDEES